MYFLSRMDPAQLILFVAFVAICFVPVATALTRFIHGHATRSNIFAAACGIYGLERLTVYISRTLDNNLLHTSLPAIGILTVLVSCFYSKVFQSGDQPKPSSPDNFERSTLQIALFRHHSSHVGTLAVDKRHLSPLSKPPAVYPERPPGSRSPVSRTIPPGQRHTCREYRKIAGYRANRTENA